MVYAPEEVRISRAVWRDASSRELIEKRIRSQMDDEEKRKYADFVIVNDGETPLIPQVLELIGSLSEKTALSVTKNRHLLNNKNKQAYFVLSSAYIIFASRKNNY